MTTSRQYTVVILNLFSLSLSLYTHPTASCRTTAVQFASPVLTTVRVFLRRQSIYAENSRTRRTTLSEQMSTTTRGTDKAWAQTNGAQSQTRTKAVASYASRRLRPRPPQQWAFLKKL